MDVKHQIQSGLICCPTCQQTLTNAGAVLTCICGRHYAMQGDIPLLLADPLPAGELSAMSREYDAPTLYQKLRNRFYKDYNCRDYERILNRLLLEHGRDAPLLSIGGGPIRRAPHITNMNIGPYPNVDLVCDAHTLCYRDGMVDAIHIDAVLEHLHNPAKAVQEIMRVLKPGGKVLSVVPFMQGYHGYPHHYQNYTLTGHVHLWRTHGFEIIGSGACQGPMVAITTLAYRFCLEYFPPVLNVFFGRALQLIALCLRPLDRLLEKHPNRHVLASSTYVLAQKP